MDYCLDLEYHYFTKIRELILKNKFFVGYERTCKYIQTMLNMLNFIRKEDNILDIEYTKSKEHKWKLTKYVNTRNASRFGKSIVDFEKFG